MMSPETAETPVTANLSQTIGRLAGVISHPEFPTGERAKLKRMGPGEPPPLAFYRFAFRHLPEGWERRPQPWMTMVAGIALMCPHPHRPDRPAGRALAESRYSEGRMERLLDAEGETQLTLLLRAARFLAAKGAACNWTDFARLLLTTDREKQEAARQHIARDYFRNLTSKD